MGFDWLTLDIEHSADRLVAGDDDLRRDRRCRLRAAGPRARRDRTTTSSACSTPGAWGIVVPMVDTVEQAKIAIAAAKYPPIGNRSVGGGMHSMNFDATAGDYYSQANDEILVVLQTESPRGVENAEAIYSLPGVDAIFIGPNDLRFQMRTPDGTFPTAEAARSGDPAGDRGRQEGRNARPASTPWIPRRASSAPSKACSSSPSAATCG